MRAKVERDDLLVEMILRCLRVGITVALLQIDALQQRCHCSFVVCILSDDGEDVSAMRERRLSFG